MKLIIIILTVISIGYCCKSEKKVSESKTIVFNLKTLPSISVIKLSDLNFTKIEYIPLETNVQSIIPGSNDLILRNKLISSDKHFIIQRFNTILDFQSDGKFVAKIGTKGRGPNEFTAATDINIHRKNQRIYLLARWQHKFFVYSGEGKLLRTFQIPFSPSEFQFIDDKILCYSENHMGNIQNSYTLIDTNGIVLKEFQNKYPFKSRDGYNIIAENLFYEFHSKLFKKEVYSDTVYQFDSDSFKPHLVIQVGEKLITKEARTEFDGLDLAKNFIIPLILFEFGDYLYYEFVYKYSLPDDVLIYSFIGSKSNDYKFLINADQGLLNDLDGGPNFLPKTVKDDETVIGWIDVLKLKAHVASEAFKNSKPKYPEKKKELEELADNLKETDNLVLVLVSL